MYSTFRATVIVWWMLPTQASGSMVAPGGVEWVGVAPCVRRHPRSTLDRPDALHLRTTLDAMASHTLEWYERLFGPCLVRYVDDVVKDEPIDGIINGCDVVGVLFAGEECEEVERLVHCYDSVNAKVVGRRRLEVVHVCSEESSKTSGGLPWFVLPTDRKDRLLRRYCLDDSRLQDSLLLLLDAFSGDLITAHGLEMLADDPDGRLFPWTPRSLSQILEDVRLIDASHQEVPHHQFKDKIKAFYFSAHWCPPCRAFTPTLIETYRCVNEKQTQLEVIMVSSDRSEESFDTYLDGMPWLAVTFEQKSLRRELAMLFGVGGIPTLVLVDAENQLITLEGRGEVNDDPLGQNFPWIPKMVNFLTERHAAKLCDCPALIIFIEGEMDEIEFAESVLHPLAQELKSLPCNKLLLLIACDSEPSDRLRELTCLEDVVPLVALVDLPGNRYATLPEGADITQNSVKTFVKDFLDDTLPMQDISRQPHSMFHSVST